MFGSWISQTKWANLSIDRRSMLLSAAGSALAAMVPLRAFGQTAQPTKRALVLGGGSILGAYQAGAIKVLLDKGFAPDYLYGISVGSLNAAFLCDRAYFLGKTKSAYYSALNETPPANSGDLNAIVNWPFIGDELVAFWQQKVTGPSSLVEQWNDTAIAIHAFMDDFNGFLSVKPLRRLIEATLSSQRLAASGVPTAIGTVNIDTAKIKYVPNTDADFITFVRASAAVPLVMPLVEIKSGANAGKYVDGGVKHIVPIKDAAAGSATHIVCIVCQAPIGQENYDPVVEPKNVVQLITRLTDIASDNVIANDMKDLRVRKVATIRPDKPIEAIIGNKEVEINNFQSKDITNMIAYGESLAAQKIKEGADPSNTNSAKLSPEYFS
ncbi:MAG: patatin-like phospholipase family protein [Rhodomicrobium sp.]